MFTLTCRDKKYKSEMISKAHDIVVEKASRNGIKLEKCSPDDTETALGRLTWFPYATTLLK